MNTSTANRRQQFVVKIEDLINDSDKTQLQIAKELGYENANIITMFKKGTTRLPLEKVADLAQAVNGDTAELIQLWFKSYAPDALSMIEKHVGAMLTPNEQSWVTGLRKMFRVVPHYDPQMTKPLREIVTNAAA
jgi:glycine betaine/choline ABC-type transport system substrate-binding protein